MSDALVGFLSAGFGAIVGSAVIHWSTGYWAKCTKREVERKIALSLVSKLVWMKAVKEAMPKFIKILIPAEALDKVTECVDGDFELRHLISIVIHELICVGSDKFGADKEKIMLVAGILELIKDMGANQSVADIDVTSLSNLDQAAIAMHYNYCVKFDDTVRAIDLCVLAVNSNTSKYIIKPEFIVNTWDSFVVLCEKADKYIDVLKRSAGISDRMVDYCKNQHLADMFGFAGKDLGNKIALGKARESAKVQDIITKIHS